MNWAMVFPSYVSKAEWVVLGRIGHTEASVDFLENLLGLKKLVFVVVEKIMFEEWDIMGE